MDLNTENGKSETPSSSTKRLVDKVMNGNNNTNCDSSSPFRLLPNFSTPPSRFFKVKNPFDSPLIERLHLPICSPGLFTKSTPKKDDKFRWSICDISNLKPAEIETSSLEQHVTYVDPSTESQIQEKISSFFNENSVVPSPLSEDIIDRYSHNHNKIDNFTNRDAGTQTRLSLGTNKLPEHVEKMLKSYETGENCGEDDDDDEGCSYLPEDVYYKKLFDFQCESPQSSPPLSTGDSPLQFSPLQELEIRSEKSFCEGDDRKELKECALSPITPEIETPQKERSCFSSLRESKSACRLDFTEKMDLSDNNIVPDVLDQISYHGNSFEDTVRTSFQKIDDISSENWDMEFNHVSMISQKDGEKEEEDENFKMDVSLLQTPNTGLFTGQRKRLSDSFRDLQNVLLGDTEGVNILEEEKVGGNSRFPEEKSAFSNEGSSSDMGYHSEVNQGSSVENTWNVPTNLFASTPTKKKIEARSDF